MNSFEGKIFELRFVSEVRIFGKYLGSNSGGIFFEILDSDQVMFYAFPMIRLMKLRGLEIARILKKQDFERDTETDPESEP